VAGAYPVSERAGSGGRRRTFDGFAQSPIGYPAWPHCSPWPAQIIFYRSAGQNDLTLSVAGSVARLRPPPGGLAGHASSSPCITVHLTTNITMAEVVCT
jgi:hypothetical protein